MQKFLSLKTQLHRISGEYCHHSKNILSYFYCFSLSAFLFLHTSSLLLHQKSRPYSTYRGGKVGLKFTVSFLRFQNVKQTQQKLAQARGFLRLFVSVLPRSVRYSFPEARSLSAPFGISFPRFSSSPVPRPLPFSFCIDSIRNAPFGKGYDLGYRFKSCRPPKKLSYALLMAYTSRPIIIIKRKSLAVCQEHNCFIPKIFETVMIIKAGNSVACLSDVYLSDFVIIVLADFVFLVFNLLESASESFLSSLSEQFFSAFVR